MSTSELIQKMKANSSRWMHENGVKRFEWQKGYGAFSVSASSTGAVREYIRRQEEHHRKHTFEEEFISLLRRYGIDYDPKFVFG
jgi:REP element-mobilizing transposase RayT